MKPPPDEFAIGIRGHELAYVNEFVRNEFVSACRCRLCGRLVTWRVMVDPSQEIPLCESWKARWRRLVDDV